MYHQTASLNRKDQIKHVFFRGLPSLFLFELVFRGLCLFFFRPIGKELIRMMLNISGDSVLFNYNILKILLSMPGIAAIILILCFSSLLTYFEFSVIFLKLYSIFTGMPQSLKTTMKLSMTTFLSISSLKVIGYFIYSVLFLPFESVILRPSIMPSLQIPNFITSEFSKRWYGPAVLNAAYLFLFLLFLALLFVLPVMILNRQTFFCSCKTSIQIWKKTDIRHICLLVLLVFVWIILFLYPGWIPTDFSELFEENMIKTLCMIFFSGDTLIKAVLAVLVWAFKTVFMLLFCTVLLSSFLQSGISVTFDIPYLKTVDRTIAAARSLVSKLYFQVSDYFHPFLQRIPHSRVTGGCIVSAFLLGAGLFLYSFAQSPPALHKPLVIGHRGSDLGIENTVTAVDGAIKSDADFAELDIQLSKDKIPVVIHDSNLSRLAQSNHSVSDLTFEELTQYSLSQNGQIDQIPSLEEIMASQGGQIRLLIELKVSSADEKEPLVDAVLALIDTYHFSNRCMIMSLDYDMVHMVQQKNPELIAGYCMFGNFGDATVQSLLDLEVDFLAIEENMVTKDFVTTCRRAWLPVYVWTVDDKEQMERYLDMGVIGLISDKPYLVREVVDSHQYSGIKDGISYYWGS